MNIILSGGGTAGHVNPAIAIAEEIMRQDENSKILFIGRRGGKENLLVTRAGIKLKTLDVEGLKRKITVDNLQVFRKAVEARKKAEHIIKEFHPDVILGTGGYVCWPIISAGQRLGVPTAIHESNVTPGLVTKMLAKRCDLVFLGYERTKEKISQKAKTCIVGTPLRADFEKISRKEARDSLGLGNNDFMILSFGGSIGAGRINDVIVETMKSFSAKKPGVVHIHGAGDRYYKELKDLPFVNEKTRCEIRPYINDMPRLMKAADVVICRCGALTLSEISAVGVASILIPSPNVSENHQYRNARHLHDCGAATVIEEKDLSQELLIKLLKELQNDKNERKNRAKKLNSFSHPDASNLIVKELKMLEFASK